VQKQVTLNYHHISQYVVDGNNGVLGKSCGRYPHDPSRRTRFKDATKLNNTNRSRTSRPAIAAQGSGTPRARSTPQRRREASLDKAMVAAGRDGVAVKKEPLKRLRKRGGGEEVILIAGVSTRRGRLDVAAGQRLSSAARRFFQMTA